MQKNFDKLHQEEQLMHQEIMNTIKKSKASSDLSEQALSLSIDKLENNEINVTIKGIKQFNGTITKHYDDKNICNGITITSDDTTIQLKYMENKNYFEAGLTYQINKEEQEDKDNLQKVSYTKTIQQGITVDKTLDLENTNTRYDKNEQMLIINVPTTTNDESTHDL
jgi:hypothetical protein